MDASSRLSTIAPVPGTHWISCGRGSVQPVDRLDSLSACAVIVGLILANCPPCSGNEDQEDRGEERS